MILTLLSILACGTKSTDTSTVIEDTSSSSSYDTTDSIDPCAPIECLEGLGMSGNVVFEDGIEAQETYVFKCANQELAS